MSSQKQILLADNNLATLQLTQQFLTHEGYRVLVASTPLEAWRISNEQDVDIILLDVRLENDADENDLSGIRLAESLNGKMATPIIIITSFESVKTVRQSLRRSYGLPPPAVDFVSKQEGFEALLLAIQKALLIDQNLLLAALESGFNKTELRGLCFRLQIDYEDLAGDDKKSVCISLILYCERNGRLPELIAVGHTLRPHKEWR